MVPVPIPLTGHLLPLLFLAPTVTPAVSSSLNEDDN